MEMQKPGAEHTYVYHEYPAVRYNANGDTRTIAGKEQEAEGWFDNPGDARKIADKQVARVAAQAAKDKESLRKKREKEKATVAELAGTDQPDEQEPVVPGATPSKSVIGRMNREGLDTLAAEMGVTYPVGTTNRKVVELINTKLGR